MEVANTKDLRTFS